MWECWNCGFQNVDAAPVCVKCRARKPKPGEKPQGRSYATMQLSAQERAVDQMMGERLPMPPQRSELEKKWNEIQANPQEIYEEMIALEQRTHALRESLRQLIQYVKSPDARGADEILAASYRALLEWEES